VDGEGGEDGDGDVDKGIHVSLLSTLEPLVSGMGRGGAGGKGGEISESNATVKLPTAGDVGGWEGVSWRPRGQGHFLSCSFNALEMESSIGPDMERSLRGGVGGRGSVSEAVDCNRSNYSNIYAFEDDIQDDIPGYTSTPSQSRLIITMKSFFQ